VDDDAGIRESLRTLLEEEGYEVIVARDGGEGLRSILASVEPLVVLLDLALPVTAGEDVLATTLEHRESDVARGRLSFVVITATWRSLVTPRLLAITSHHDIPIEEKPFEIERLLTSMERAAARAASSASSASSSTSTSTSG
jgi:DNA-binding NtrC family response regulator